MIALPPQVRVFLYRLPTDMRKSFNGLVALTESALKQDPLDSKRQVVLLKNTIGAGAHRAYLAIGNLDRMVLPDRTREFVVRQGPVRGTP